MKLLQAQRTPKIVSAAVVAALVYLSFPTTPALSLHKPRHPRGEQGLDPSEYRAFAKALPALLANRDVDMVVSLRRAATPTGRCPLTGNVYWVHAKRGTICFTRRALGAGWRFKSRLVRGKNPIGRRSNTALATLASERAASSHYVEDPERRNLVAASAVTYPFAYERTVAELDSERTGDFIIIPANTADRGGKGAHGHLGVTQSRSTLLVAGRGARRTPLGRAAEARLRIKHVDIAPTVARALGVKPYFEDTGTPARLLNGRTSKTALLQRQDGRVIDSLLEPVFNTFVVVVDGLRPEDVNPTLMPNLTALLDETCEPGGACATSYAQARAVMVTETNANHTAMLTGAYGNRSGIFANQTLDRSTGSDIDFDEPQLNLAETLFDAIERQKPWLRTALVMGKDKLRELFDCTRRADGECGSSTDNPEGVRVSHVRPDLVGGATTSPSSPATDCPAEPGTASGYTSNDCVMDVALRFLNEEDPDLTFINLPEVDGFAHLFGAGSPEADAAVADSDEQIGRLIEALKDSGKWQHSVVVVTSDHGIADTANAESKIFLDNVFAGAGPSPFEVVSHDGSASVYLSDLTNLQGPLTPDQQATLKDLRDRALATEGIEEALYRLPNTRYDDPNSTLDAARAHWRLHGNPRVGELLITADKTHTLVEQELSEETPVLGHHGHPAARHVPLIVASGGTYVKDQAVKAVGSVDISDDTAAFPAQAESVDVAPSIAWLLGINSPVHNQGRVLREAFVKHPLDAQRSGDITEPIAKRGAIFIFDANNSVDLHCLLRATTCGNPVPEEAIDPDFVPNLRKIAEDGLLTAFGSIAAWPSVTFPNHNTVGAGVYPGHHGMVNNRFYLRESKEKEAPIEPTDPDNPVFLGTSRLLVGGIETLHEAIHRSRGDWEPGDGPSSDKAYTAAVDEPSARGADYATLEPDQSHPNPAVYIATENPAELAEDSTPSCGENESYATESILDHQGQTQAQRLYDDRATHPLPTYLINNFTLTDGAGHVFGPHTECTLASYHDSDSRFGRILDAMRRAGVLGETLIVVTGDHGMENQNLSRRGLPSDFEAFLSERGIKHVMTDWHVYLLTMNVRPSHRNFRVGRRTTVTFKVRDEDNGAAVDGARITIRRVRNGPIRGTTNEDGEVELSFTPKQTRHQSLKVTTTHADFNPRVQGFRVRRTIRSERQATTSAASDDSGSSPRRAGGGDEDDAQVVGTRVRSAPAAAPGTLAATGAGIAAALVTGLLAIAAGILLARRRPRAGATTAESQPPETPGAR